MRISLSAQTGRRRSVLRICAFLAGWLAAASVAAQSQRAPSNVPVAPAPKLHKGDCWQYRNLRIRRGLRDTVRCVVRIVNDGYLMETQGRVTGLARYDRNLVWVSTIGSDRTIRQPARSKVPLRLTFPLWPGKNWVDAYRTIDPKTGGFFPIRNLYIVEAYEDVEVPAGRFKAFRIKRIRINIATAETNEGLTWYAPSIQNVVQVWNNWEGGTKAVLSAVRLSGGRSPVPMPLKKEPGRTKIRASHILVKEEATAREILRRLRAGESFKALAQEFSIDPSKRFGGDIGFFKKGELLPGLEKLLRGMKVGEFGGPVRTKRGFHILKRTG